MCRISWISPAFSCHVRALTHFHSYQLPLCSLSLFSLRSRSSIFSSLFSYFILSLSFSRPSHPLSVTFLYPVNNCDTFHFLFNLHLMPLVSLSFLSWLPPSHFSVSSEGTHHVNMRQTSVLMSITTWLNMAECVRWIALWRSFCRDRHRYEFIYENSNRTRLLHCHDVNWLNEDSGRGEHMLIQEFGYMQTVLEKPGQIN